jgi:hypothetical protein
MRCIAYTLGGGVLKPGIASRFGERYGKPRGRTVSADEFDEISIIKSYVNQFKIAGKAVQGILD